MNEDAFQGDILQKSRKGVSGTPKTAYFANVDHYLYAYRKELMFDMKRREYRVYAVASASGKNAFDVLGEDGRIRPT